MHEEQKFYVLQRKIPDIVGPRSWTDYSPKGLTKVTEEYYNKHKETLMWDYYPVEELEKQKSKKEEMKVFEYVAYYAPTAEQLSATKEKTGELLEAKILLDDKMLAESEEAVRRKVIRAIPALYEPVLDQIRVEVRAFR